MAAQPTTKPFDPFRSPRLVYRACHDDSPSDEAFVHAIQRDAEAQSGSSYGLLRPETTKSSRGFRDHISSGCLLGAIVCLSPAEERKVKQKAGDAEAEVDTETEDEEKKMPDDLTTLTPIGIICLRQNPASQAHHRWTDVSIDVLASYTGQGYGSEAIRWATWYGFQMAGLHKVQIQAFSFNDGACRLYERLGFKLEARLRHHMWFDGGWHDNLIFGMLEDEWRDLQAQGKAKLKN